MLPNAAAYEFAGASELPTPALVLFYDLLVKNLQGMIAVAGSAARLRPHCKTHKIREVTELELQMGIAKHKAATLAEAEMLALAGAKDVLLAYNPVGPNIARVVAYRQKYPDVQFMVTADHPAAVTALGQATEHAGTNVGVLLDLETGMGRTGIAPGPAAAELYHLIARTPGLVPQGFHLYDGHQQQADRAEREAAVARVWQPAAALRDELVAAGLPVPRIVAGGTGTFPIYAAYQDPVLELSPGTTVFHDFGYSSMFADIDFTPAAVLLTRVISRPRPDRVTLDLGYKAVASDPPMGKRLYFPELPEAREVVHNEEHLVLEMPEAHRFAPGDLLVAIPRHICPTTAMHEFVTVVRGGSIVDRWEVVGRKRCLTI